MPYRLKSVSITNVLGIKSLSFEAGKVTVLSGGNGVGKTSVLDAISSVFERGHDPGLIRNGAATGEVVLTLDNDTTIRNTIKPKESSLEVRTADGGAVKAPVAWVRDNLSAAFAFDPLALIDAPKKERAAVLMQAMPIEFSAEEVVKATGNRSIVKPMNLSGLDAVRLGCCEDRRKHNQRVESLDSVISSMRSALPDGDAPEDVTQRASEAARKLEAARAELASTKSDIAAQAERLKAEARAELHAKCEEIDRNAAAALAANTAEIQGEIESLTGEAAQLDQLRLQHERAAGARREIEKQTADRQKAFGKATRLGAAIKAIDALKLSKLAELPIEGIDVRDGEIYIGGVAWPHVNTATQYRVCCQIAFHLSGQLPLIVMDRAESMDDAQFEDLKKAAAGVGLQVIAARVDGGPLKVKVA